MNRLGSHVSIKLHKVFCSTEDIVENVHPEDRLAKTSYSHDYIHSVCHFCTG